MPAHRKTSLAQVIELLVYLEKHKNIQLGTAAPKALGTKESEHWQKIAKILNNCPGEPKDAGKWKSYWSELKWRCRKKASKGRPLLPYEKRVLNLAGGAKRYTIGVSPTERLMIKPKKNSCEEKHDANSEGEMDFMDNTRFLGTRDPDCLTPDPMPIVDPTMETSLSYQDEKQGVEEKIDQKHSLHQDVPEWVRRIEHSRLGLEERSTRAMEQMSAGITAMAEAMRSIVGSLHSIEASIRNLNTKS